MSSPFDRIENRLQAFIENSLSRLPWRNSQPRLAAPLVNSLQEQLSLDPSSNEPLPDSINIFLHPEVCTAWESHADWQEWLAQVIMDMTLEQARKFAREPEVRFLADETLRKNDVSVVLSYQDVNVSSTAVITPDADPINAVAESRSGPFLILEGDQIYPLQAPVINIGRREGNDLVLSDLRVSREHAQIRIIHGECVLFDLNSTGGTFVNGQRITSHSLQPGDVIVMAGASLIFGQDSPNSPRATGTSPAYLPSRDGDQP